MPPVLRLLCNVTILSGNYYNRFVLFVKSGKQWAAPPDGGAARRISAQPEQRLHPQPVDVDVPATVPLGCVQVQVQVQVGFVVEVPPTEPVVCLQQGLQHRC